MVAHAHRKEDTSLHLRAPVANENKIINLIGCRVASAQRVIV